MSEDFKKFVDALLSKPSPQPEASEIQRLKKITESCIDALGESLSAAFKGYFGSGRVHRTRPGEFSIPFVGEAVVLTFSGDIVIEGSGPNVELTYVAKRTSYDGNEIPPRVVTVNVKDDKVYIPIDSLLANVKQAIETLAKYG